MKTGIQGQERENGTEAIFEEITAMFTTVKKH